MMNIYMNDLMKPYYETKQEVSGKIKSSLKKKIKRSIFRSKRINDDIGERIVVYEMCKGNDIFKDFNNITEYEYACNELFWSGEEVLYRQEHCVNILLEILSGELKRKYRNETFCIYISFKEGEEGYIQAWFHLYRNDEYLLWPCELNEFNNPVLFVVV